MTRYFCCEESRVDALREHGTLNGIDYLEVLDDPALPPSQRQHTLRVHFVKEDHLATLDRRNVRIEGGERIRDVGTDGVQVDGADPHVLVVTVDHPGDFSTYTLRLVRDAGDDAPPDGFDPVLAAVDFSFKAGCRSSFDCRRKRVGAPGQAPGPEIDYLAKDYASFLRLMFDRLSLLMPDWSERNPADGAIALVELLAYVGDYLSYRQDAIGTEAYLNTARRRTSVRRHARLVDYDMHDGCNARTWVQVIASANGIRLPAATPLLTAVAGHDPRIPPDSPAYRAALSQAPETFETMHPIILFKAHNEMHFYAWGDRECCLPKGATRATLCGALPHLKAGDVLILVQQRDPVTGLKEDANPAHRHAVRLTHVQVSADPLGGRIIEHKRPDDDARAVTQIEWDASDALPFPFCVSGTTSLDADGGYREDISVALGNVVLADHGRTRSKAEPLGRVPEPTLHYDAPRTTENDDRCQRRAPEPIPPRYRPRLQSTPLTQAVPHRQQRLFGLPFSPQQQADLDNQTLPADLRQELVNRGVQFDPAGLSIQGTKEEWSLSDGAWAYVVRREDGQLNVYALLPAASQARRWGPQEARPAITLYSPAAGDPHRETWTPMRHLLNSGPSTREFVVEVEADGSTEIRFGDDQFGRRPEPGTACEAVYRVGNGARGNVGAKTLVHIVSNDTGIDATWNPLPAWGGVEPESIDRVQQMAPYVFRTQERAVTAQDTAEIATRHPQVQRAAATLRWTGSWYTVYLTVDRLGGLEVDEPFRREMVHFLERYRMAGHDVEIDGPRYVPLEIEMAVCVKPDYFRAHVGDELLRIYSADVVPDGRRGVFHPDNFTFGQPVYLSQLYAAAQKVEGIEFYEVTTFQRQGLPSRDALDDGKLILGRLEIARLDNDPNFPEHGVFRLHLEGGR